MPLACVKIRGSDRFNQIGHSAARGRHTTKDANVVYRSGWRLQIELAGLFVRQRLKQAHYSRIAVATGKPALDLFGVWRLVE